jgi:hypothetical protein
MLNRTARTGSLIYRLLVARCRADSKRAGQRWRRNGGIWKDTLWYEKAIASDRKGFAEVSSCDKLGRGRNYERSKQNIG